MAAHIFTSITQDDDWPSGWLPYDSGTEAGPAVASVFGGRTTGTFCTKFEHAVWQEEIYSFFLRTELLRVSRHTEVHRFSAQRTIRPTIASMNNGSNITMDPRCRDKPPLAIDIILSE